MTDWLVPLISAIVSGVTAVPVWNTIMKMTGRGATEIDRLRLEVRENSTKHARCEEKVAALAERILQIEHHHASAFARWILDVHKRITWVNSKALISIFGPIGLTRDEIEGRTFRDLLDKQAADELDRLAMAALNHDNTPVSNLIRLHPDLPVMQIVKMATDGRNGELIFEAIAFRTNDPDVIIGLGVARTAAQRRESIDRLASKDEPPPHG